MTINLWSAWLYLGMSESVQLWSPLVQVIIIKRTVRLLTTSSSPAKTMSRALKMYLWGWSGGDGWYIALCTVIYGVMADDDSV